MARLSQSTTRAMMWAELMLKTRISQKPGVPSQEETTSGLLEDLLRTEQELLFPLPAPDVSPFDK